MSGFLTNLLNRHNSGQAVVKPRLLSKFESGISASPPVNSELQPENRTRPVFENSNTSDERSNNGQSGVLKADTLDQNLPAQQLSQTQLQEDQQVRKNAQKGELSESYSPSFSNTIGTNPIKPEAKVVLSDQSTTLTEHQTIIKQPISQYIDNSQINQVTQQIQQSSVKGLLNEPQNSAPQMVVKAKEVIPTIKVSIGRIEVNAKPNVPKKQTEKRPSKKPNISLEEYMKKQKTGS